MNYDPFNNSEIGFYFGYGDQHISALEKFAEWLRRRYPEAYATIANERPDLLNARKVIIADELSVDQQTLEGLASGDQTAEPATSWGTQFLDFLKNALPTYYQARAQRDIIETNLRRAEMGLDPIDSGTVAPQVQVGASADVKTLGYVAIGALALVGLALARRR